MRNRKAVSERQPAWSVLNRIYTRTGDDGTTSLGSGERRKKYDLRVAAYGTLDEVNAVHRPGAPARRGRRAARCRAGAHPERSVRRRGRPLPVGEGTGRRPPDGHGRAGGVARRARSIASTPSLRRCARSCCRAAAAAAAYLHLARTVCRRAERLMVELKDTPGETVTAPSLQIRQPPVRFPLRRGPLRSTTRAPATCSGSPGQNAMERAGRL